MLKCILKTLKTEHFMQLAKLQNSDKIVYRRSYQASQASQLPQGPVSCVFSPVAMADSPLSHRSAAPQGAMQRRPAPWCQNSCGRDPVDLSMAQPWNEGPSQATGARHLFLLEINAHQVRVAKIFSPKRIWSKSVELQPILLSNTEFQGTCATSFSTSPAKTCCNGVLFTQRQTAGFSYYEAGQKSGSVSCQEDSLYIYIYLYT